MDATQLSKLKEISDQAKKPVVIHDLRDIISKKILINKITVEFLKTQRKFAELSQQLQQYSADDIDQKILIVNRLITLYEEQMKEFTDFRQEECISLYADLNSLQDVRIPGLVVELDRLDHKIRDLSVKIDALEQTVPSIKEGIQYELRKKQNAGHSGCLE